VDVACRAFHQETLDDDDDNDVEDASTEGEDGVSPKEVQLLFTYFNFQYIIGQQILYNVILLVPTMFKAFKFLL
jgi:hypothetical protein